MREFPKREPAFTGEFMKELKNLMQEKLWFAKIHGHEMQTRGIPDVLCCINGIFVGIEFKIKRNNRIVVTPYQAFTKIVIEKSNGFCFVVSHNEDDASVSIDDMIFKNRKEAAMWLFSRFKA